MKKHKTKNQEQKPRRLSLSRETIRFLNDPALLGLARGGDLTGNPCISGNTDTGSNADTNCYPTSGTSRGPHYQ
jgi:hypothetical protein